MFPFAMRGWFVTIGDMPACRQRFQLDYVPLERYSRHSPSPSTNKILKKKKKRRLGLCSLTSLLKCSYRPICDLFSTVTNPTLRPLCCSCAFQSCRPTREQKMEPICQRYIKQPRKVAANNLPAAARRKVKSKKKNQKGVVERGRRVPFISLWIIKEIN